MPQPDTEDRLLTIKETAHLLHISVPTLRRMVWANQIGYVNLNKYGTHIAARFTAKNIQDFLKSREVSVG